MARLSEQELADIRKTDLAYGPDITRTMPAVMHRRKLLAELDSTRLDLLQAMAERNHAERERDALKAELAKVTAERDAAELERDTARAFARILAHSYEHDSRPPDGVVAHSLAFPVGAARELSTDDLYDGDTGTISVVGGKGEHWCCDAYLGYARECPSCRRPCDCAACVAEHR